MTIISKETEIQGKLSSIFDELISKKESIRKELIETRLTYKRVCDKHILSGFTSEYEWLEATNNHQNKFVEYDIHCYLIEILSDYRNIEGDFPEYPDMTNTLESVMFKFANEERYEVSAIIQIWLNKLLVVGNW